MTVVLYTNSGFNEGRIKQKPSVFLAGPTPRTPSTPSWRPEAVSIFKKRKFDGHIFVPEDSDNAFIIDDDEKVFDWMYQVTWETKMLKLADVIMFWIPRNMKTMPGLTTNVEYGMWIIQRPEKVVLGFPDWACNTNYLKYHAEEKDIPVVYTLEATVIEVIKKLR